MYTYRTKIRLHETDAAGLLFFSNQFSIIHDAYECVLEKIGFSFAQLIRKHKFFLPIVHAESDYKAPLFVGDHVDIQVVVESVGTTSFIFVYKLICKGKVVGTARTVHVTINNKTHKKIPLPPLMRKRIENLCQADKRYRKN